jgi:response regulator NasT
MKILLVDDSSRSLEPVLEALRLAGHEVESEHDPGRLLRRVDQWRPDIVLIDTDSPGRDVLEPLCILSVHNPLPLVMFSGDSSQASIVAATDAGVSAYIAQHIDIERLQPILAVAEARFRREQKLRDQLEAAAKRAEDRKLIDTAKGMLMVAHGLSEADAYRRLQQSAMDQCAPLRCVAERLIKKRGSE